MGWGNFSAQDVLFAYFYHPTSVGSWLAIMEALQAIGLFGAALPEGSLERLLRLLAGLLGDPAFLKWLKTALAKQALLETKGEVRQTQT
jgi:hypothetical protein